jgi:hypothetical protein
MYTITLTYHNGAVFQVEQTRETVGGYLEQITALMTIGTYANVAIAYRNN